MKKEKTIRTYQRRTKSGKVVTVKQHTAKYDAAEALKEAAKKKGAGDELETLKKKKGKYEILGVDLSDMSDEDFKEFASSYMDENDNPAPTTRAAFKRWAEKQDWGREGKALFKEGVAEFKKNGGAKGVATGSSPKKSDTSYGFTADEYKAWYHWDQEADPKNKTALKVEKALKKQMGTKAYNKYFDEVSDNYSARGHNKAFKGLGDTFGDKKKQVTPTKETKVPKTSTKESGDIVEHYDQFNKKYKGKAVGKPFRFKENEFTYDARFVTDGKGNYEYVIKDVEEGPKGKYYVGTVDATKLSELAPGVRKAAKEAGLTFKDGVWSVSSSKETKAKSISKESTGDFKGHPKVMAKIDKLVQSYQKDIERAQKHIDAGDVRPGGKFSHRMSYKEQKRYAEGQISKLEKGRDAHLAGKENKAWGYLRGFVGFNENNVIGKETRAKNKVAAEKEQQKRENDRIKQAQLRAQRVAESVERLRKTREAMSGAKRIPADLLKKATTKSRNGKHPVTSIYYGDKTLVEIGGTYYKVTKAEMKNIRAAMPSKPAKRYTK